VFFPPLCVLPSAASFAREVQLSGGGQDGAWALSEEPHQSLDVLGSRRQEELFSHELQSPQAQATQSNLILKFREQGFHLLPLPLCMGEL